MSISWSLTLLYRRSSFILRISLCCNLYGDFCDAEEADMEEDMRRWETCFVYITHCIHLYLFRVRRNVDQEREALKEHNRTQHALTVSRTLDYIFHESRYDPKFRLVTRNVVLEP